MGRISSALFPVSWVSLMDVALSLDRQGIILHNLARIAREGATIVKDGKVAIIFSENIQ